MLLCRLHIEAELDPQLPARLLAIAAVRNDLPENFSLTKGAAQLEIVLEALCRDEPCARLLMDRIRSIPTVNHVTCVLLPSGVVEADEAPATPAFWI